MPAPPFPIPAHLYTNCNNLLTSLGLSPNQVRVVLYKDADSGRPDDGPGLAPIPSSGFVDCATSYSGQPPYPDACNLMHNMGGAARTVKGVYPNVQQMFVHSRIYGGYANPNDSAGNYFQRLNPEPFAYEHGFAMKWFIQAQIDEVKHGTVNPVTGPLNYNQAPWIDWGAYLWAAGKWIPCNNCGWSPSLTWSQDVLGPAGCVSNGPPSEECDFQATFGNMVPAPPDNTHPSNCGRDKVSKMLVYQYCNGVVPTETYMQPWLVPPGSGSCYATKPTQCDYLPQ